MNLSPPTMIVFIISVILAAIGILPMFGVAIPVGAMVLHWALPAAYVLLAAGVLFKGL